MAEVKHNEKVIQLYEEGGAIGTLNDMIGAIRDKRIRNFAVIAQMDGDGEITTFGKDAGGEPAKRNEIVTQYYFFGNDHLVAVMGMVKRLSHILDLYMDGVDIFGDDL